MSKAKEIADERLAKGEISAEEHEALLARLTNAEEQPQDAPQEHVTPAPENLQADLPEWLPTALLIGGAYLLACFVVAFGVDLKSRMYNAALSGCSNPNSALCQCVANAARDEVTFLLAPLQVFGMFVNEDMGRHCVRVRN